MESPNYTLEQYATKTSLINIQLESVEIEKKSSIPVGSNAQLSIQISINFTHVTTLKKEDNINVSLTIEFNAVTEDENGEKIELFTAKLKTLSVFFIRFKHEPDLIIHDCGNNTDIQSIFINQIYPVTIDYARNNLNAMGFTGIPIPYYISGALSLQK